jgi:hypothetical protein
MPPGRHAGRGPSPTPATPLPDGLVSKAPGPLATQPRGADRCHGDAHHHPTSSRTSAGRPRAGSVHAPDDSSHEGHTPPWSPGPWRGSWRASWGPWPERCRSPPQTTRAHGCHPHRRRFPTGLGRDAAPVGCHPRPRSAAGRGDSSLDGGRHPTDARQMVANPRIAAGSTVESDWLRLCRCTEDNNILMT